MFNFQNPLGLNIELSESQDVLDEVVVEAKESDENTKGTQMGKIDLSMDKIKNNPSIYGRSRCTKKPFNFCQVFHLEVKAILVSM